MNIVVITARTDSERLPGKALIELGGVPNLIRLVRRLDLCRRVDKITIAHPIGDNAIDDACGEINHFAGSKDDVLARVIGAAEGLVTYKRKPSEAVNVLRLTTDCPFISWRLIDLAFEFLEKNPGYETARLWGLGEQVPVYGAAEFPVTLECLKKIHTKFDVPVDAEGYLDAKKTACEHVTSDIDRDRMQYKVAYAVPPKCYTETYYRPYRLELDTPQDLELVNRIIAELGLNPPLEQVVRFLDENPELAAINGSISEKTGPSMYDRAQKARWKSQQATHSYSWLGDWSWLDGVEYPGKLPAGARPIYCKKGIHYHGYVVKDGKHKLVTKDGDAIIGRATFECACGDAGRREWYEG